MDVINQVNDEGDYMKNYTIIVNEDDILLLQKYNYEILGYSNIVEKIITTNPNNPAILNGDTWKSFYSQYQEAVIGYDRAKYNFMIDVLQPIVFEKEGKEIPFDWEIKDLLYPIVDIVIKEE